MNVTDDDKLSRGWRVV